MDVDVDVLGRLLALLALLLFGAGLRTVGLLDTTRTAWLNAAAYYVALPALVFVATYDRAIDELLSPSLAGGLALVFGLTAGIAWLVHRNRAADSRRSVAIVQSYHSNLGYLGLPLVAATFADDVTAIASVVLGVVTLLQLPLTILVLSSLNGANATLSAELRRLATNPVLLSLLAGLAIGSAHVSVAPAVTTGLDVLSMFALPLALLCVGASLQIDTPSVDAGATGAVVALKICCMPLLAWAIFSWLAVDTATITATVVMLGTPTAVSTFVFANELGGDEAFASLNVFVTTLASIATLFVLITLVG
ncbi:auxin efflux carrier [Natrialba aegyptia DSM 13077]|uniref:Auxin efflux carrier n=1 Tax=Natrialba aegyptia DSM 13077 TaxID=1227491 RepID=M0AXN1_9EURY|nr:auxin efflux carrier [Natrialba aegyptia DSM 13077]